MSPFPYVLLFFCIGVERVHFHREEGKDTWRYGEQQLCVWHGTKWAMKTGMRLLSFTRKDYQEGRPGKP